MIDVENLRNMARELEREAEAIARAVHAIRDIILIFEKPSPRPTDATAPNPPAEKPPALEFPNRPAAPTEVAIFDDRELAAGAATPPNAGGDTPAPPRRRGRIPGSKNKPKSPREPKESELSRMADKNRPKVLPTIREMSGSIDFGAPGPDPEPDVDEVEQRDPDIENLGLDLPEDETGEDALEHAEPLEVIDRELRQKGRARKRRAPNLDAGVSSTPPSAPAFEYSKPVTCMKCKASNARYRRAVEHDPARDYWTCTVRSCQVRISHIRLGVDRNYRPEAP